jgi:hypothetical protein
LYLVLILPPALVIAFSTAARAAGLIEIMYLAFAPRFRASELVDELSIKNAERMATPESRKLFWVKRFILAPWRKLLGCQLATPIDS